MNMVDFDGKGLHVHDKIDGQVVSYGIKAGEDGLPELVNLGGQHASEFDAALARKSMQNLLADPDQGIRLLREVNARNFSIYPVESRSTGRTLKVLKNLGRAAGAAGALVAIANATSSSLHAAEVANSYARNVSRGDTAFADLDAIEIATSVGEATGNYFIGYEALDLLLQ